MLFRTYLLSCVLSLIVVRNITFELKTIIISLKVDLFARMLSPKVSFYEVKRKDSKGWRVDGHQNR